MIDTARRRLLACAAMAAALPAVPVRTARAAQAPVIGFVRGSAVNDPTGSFGAGDDAIRAAAARDGIAVKFAAPWRPASSQPTTQASPQASPQESQVAAIRSFIAENVSLIVLAPAADSGWEGVLREAKAAAIPVIVTGRAIAAREQELAATFVGPDPAAQARQAGRWLAAHAARTAGAPVNIVELQGAHGSPQTLAHHGGFAQAIAGHPRLKMLQSGPGGQSRAGAMAAMGELLRIRGGQIHAVYAHSADLALGAIDAIEQAGMRPGRDIAVVSAGGGADAAAAMASGKLNLAIACQLPSAIQLVQVARDVMAGRRVPRWITPQ